MKEYKKGLLTGLFLAIIALTLMAFTKDSPPRNERGRYQIYMNPTTPTKDTRGFLLDTETGETWYLDNKEKKIMEAK